MLVFIYTCSGLIRASSCSPSCFLIATASLCKAISMSYKSPSLDHDSVYSEDMEPSEAGDGHDQIFFPFDMLSFLANMDNIPSLNHALENIKPLQIPSYPAMEDVELVKTPHAALPAVFSFNSEHSLAPHFSIPCRKSVSKTIEYKDGDPIPNPTSDPSYSPRQISEEDDNTRGTTSDVYPSVKDLQRRLEKHYTTKGSTKNVVSCSPNQKKIWGVTRTSCTGNRNVGFGEPYEKKFSMDTELYRNELCTVSKQNPRVHVAPLSKATKKRGARPVLTVRKARDQKKGARSMLANQSDHACTLFEHTGSVDRNEMRLGNIWLDKTHEKSSRCKGKTYKSKKLVSERQRRRRLNEKLYSLRALVPNISKMDKASIIRDAISYLRELKRQVEELQVEVSHLAAAQEAIANGLRNPNI